MNDSFKPCCDRCGTELQEFREGNSEGMRCPACGWSVVTTFMPEILADPALYEVRVTNGDAHNTAHVKAVAGAHNVNLLAARRLLETEQRPLLFSGKAPDVARVRDALAAAGLNPSISPEFRW